jgi:hypothetical protein
LIANSSCIFPTHKYLWARKKEKGICFHINKAARELKLLQRAIRADFYNSTAKIFGPHKISPGTEIKRRQKTVFLFWRKSEVLSL